MPEMKNCGTANAERGMALLSPLSIEGEETGEGVRIAECRVQIVE
jgi:hypothetical protein